MATHHNPQSAPPRQELEVHEHLYVSGPRGTAGYHGGVWLEAKVSHSHPGGSQPHTHPHTGPSFYSRNSKLTQKPTGEQFEQLIPLTEEESSFDLVITDSALIHGKTPIGDTPVNVLGFPAAERMVTECRMKCVIRDERKGKGGAA